jgi:hypothetical protein
MVKSEARIQNIRRANSIAVTWYSPRTQSRRVLAPHSPPLPLIPSFDYEEWTLDLITLRSLTARRSPYHSGRGVAMNLQPRSDIHNEEKNRPMPVDGTSVYAYGNFQEPLCYTLDEMLVSFEIICGREMKIPAHRGGKGGR